MSLARAARVRALLSMFETMTSLGEGSTGFVAVSAGPNSGNGTITSGLATVLDMRFDIVDARQTFERRSPAVILAMVGKEPTREIIHGFVRDVLRYAPGSLVAVACPEGWTTVQMQEIIAEVPNALASFHLAA